jgi:hypothetical protein
MKCRERTKSEKHIVKRKLGEKKKICEKKKKKEKREREREREREKMKKKKSNST